MRGQVSILKKTVPISLVLLPILFPASLLSLLITLLHFTVARTIGSFASQLGPHPSQPNFSLPTQFNCRASPSPSFFSTTAVPYLV